MRLISLDRSFPQASLSTNRGKSRHWKRLTLFSGQTQLRAIEIFVKGGVLGNPDANMLLKFFSISMEDNGFQE